MISPSRNELNDSVREYVAEATAIDINSVIPGDDNAPSPLNLYASVKYVTDATNGIDNIRYTNNVDDENLMDFNLRGTRFISFSVQFYRAGAADAAKRLLTYHLTPAGRIFIGNSPWEFKEAREHTDIDTVISTLYEERAAITFIVYAYETMTQTLNKIDRVPINLSADSGDQTLTETLNVEE